MSDPSPLRPVPAEMSAAREQFLALVADIRPELHRYCSRLVGSAIDGEDVVHEALAKAFYAIGMSDELPPLRPWLFRIAHNAAVDFLRRYERRFVEPVAELPEIAVTADEEADPELVRAALSSFLALPLAQRSAVILKDVLGQTNEEIATATGATLPAVKALLVRGRASLRLRARAGPDPVPWRDRPETSAAEERLLERYLTLFNARDWDSLRTMLVDDCRLDLVSKAQRRGKGVGQYFARYAAEPEVRLVRGRTEGREVLGVFRGDDPRLASVIVLDGDGEHVSFIRDYRYVPYLAAALDFEPAASTTPHHPGDEPR